jgi:hypothetical protein
MLTGSHNISAKAEPKGDRGEVQEGYRRCLQEGWRLGFFEDRFWNWFDDGGVKGVGPYSGLK